MKRRVCAMTVLLLLFCAPPVTAQEVNREPVVLKMTWIDAQQMVQLLELFFHGRIYANEALNSIAFFGSDEEKALIEEFVKRYDVAPAGLEFQFYVLRASTGGEGLRDGVPDFVRKVLREVGALTRFSSFELIDSPVIRAREGRKTNISGQGPLAYEIGLNPKLVVREGQTRSIRVDDCRVQYRLLRGYTVGDQVVDAAKAEAEMEKQGVQYVVKPIYKTAGLQTSFVIGDGETVVLGASRMPAKQDEDWAIITVVTARLLE